VLFYDPLRDGKLNNRGVAGMRHRACRTPTTASPDRASARHKNSAQQLDAKDRRRCASPQAEFSFAQRADCRHAELGASSSCPTLETIAKLNAIREFFDAHIGSPATQGNERHTIEVATAALLAEMVRIDSDIGDAERAAVLRAVREKFGLTEDEADTLVRLAEEEAREATDYYQFTSLINKRFSAEQKERVIELMWQIAYADAQLSADEQHLVRKIADLLYVPHSAYIAAKFRARDAGSG
jgi:uncharacterized tellurite resistance protein B-like protein